MYLDVFLPIADHHLPRKGDAICTSLTHGMESNFIHIGVYGQPHSNMHNDTDPKDRKRKKKGKQKILGIKKIIPVRPYVRQKILGIRVNEAIMENTKRNGHGTKTKKRRKNWRT